MAGELNGREVTANTVGVLVLPVGTGQYRIWEAEHFLEQKLRKQQFDANWADQPSGESSAAIRERVVAARQRQLARSGKTNAQLSQAETTATCGLSQSDHALLERAVDALQLSARSMHRIQRVARTIADLAESPQIATAHLTEAIGYRRGEREAAA